MEVGATLKRLTTGIAVAVVLFGSVMAAIGPVGADTAGRPDDPTPDEVYYEVTGPSYPEGKDGGGEGASTPQGGGARQTVTSAAMDGLTTSVTFPYVNFNWTVYSWYPTFDGLRFYGVFYKNEQILFDYRAPWIRVNGVKYALTTQQLISGPDLQVFYSGFFLVKATYNLGNPNVDVTVVTRFYGDGNMEPWVLVDTHNAVSALIIGQRFDFDLGGWSDDNQQYYFGTGWRTSTTEGHYTDASAGENASGYQWRDFDTDQVGGTNVIDQEVAVKPYHPDNAVWFQLCWDSSSPGGEPGLQENGGTINLFQQGQPDPWVGADALNWYVSTYSAVTVAYPGPWIRAFV